jgi:hypothetical protein
MVIQRLVCARPSTVNRFYHMNGNNFWTDRINWLLGDIGRSVSILSLQRFPTLPQIFQYQPEHGPMAVNQTGAKASIDLDILVIVIVIHRYMLRPMIPSNLPRSVSTPDIAIRWVSQLYYTYID